MVALALALPPAARALRAQALEDQRLVVRGLSFEGNHAIDDYTLRISIATSNSSLWERSPLLRWLPIGEKKYFDETEFRRDVLRLILLYRISGYMEVQVDTTVRRTDRAVWVRFDIHEGPPIRVRSLTISGLDAIVRERDLVRDLPIATGDPFNRVRFEWAADTIRAALRDRGYPFAEVYRSYDVNEDSLTADLAFEASPGALATVDTVIVEGTRAISPQVVRRMIPVRAGMPFSQRDLYESQRSLYRLGTFSYVNVALADSSPPPGDSAVAVRVQVSEGKLHRLRVGAGLGTVDCVRALGTWTVSNAFGGGRELDLRASASKLGAVDPFDAGFRQFPCTALKDEDTTRLKVNYNVTLSFQEPFLFSRLNRGTLSLSAERHTEILAYLRDAYTADLSVTRQTRWNIPVTVSYSLSLSRTLAEPATFCAYLNVCRVEDTELFTQQRVQSMLGLNLVRDRSNSVLDPTRGSVFTAEVRYAGRSLGSDSLIQFAKGVASFAAYHQLGRRTTFAWRIRAGSILSPQLGLGGQNVQFVPPAERFYAGGPNSVRGYGQNAMGPIVRVLVSVDSANGEPKDSTIGTSPTGGNQLVIANAELRFPLPAFGGRLTGAVFVDAGQLIVRSPDKTFDLSGYRVTPGAGIRITTPLGPIRLDLAYNGYPPEEGPLYERTVAALPLLDPAYTPRQAPGIFHRLHLHIAVGQAF